MEAELTFCTIRFFLTIFVSFDNQDININQCVRFVFIPLFTPEYEVPFAGHPTLGTAYVISKYLLSEPKKSILLKLKHADIRVDLSSVDNLDFCDFVMEQAQPEFIKKYGHEEIAVGLGIDFKAIDFKRSIEEISTGIPYIIIPIISLKEMNGIKLNSDKIIEFLIKNKCYKTNSWSELSTSLFFITEETYEKFNNYNGRMFCIENGDIIEDSATGSANGCFLAYLLKNNSNCVSAIVEQGFQMNRKSYIKLQGKLHNSKFSLKVGGNVVELSKGTWSI
ncbi:PhzF family phenazine biosynthesis protein [uncultured Draconibacterium sp.]|uniref:PhzF family phenazine biosynthesis protein n=1 Tax=uncultured Draconibacterium sp. TaxID=1573823 RepID=UPI0025EFE69A|nr:PhzF family phenazine biosynthesis isomerase [uncultured Draconibacterium sp.]